MADRGGLTLKSGKIGRVNCLRQQYLMPGEIMKMNVAGDVKLEALRERDALRINAKIVSFWTPIRWLMTDFPTYVTEGSESSTATKGTTAVTNLSDLGIGTGYTSATNIWDVFENNIIKIHNEWFKWPESSDVSSIPEDGNIAVPLSKAWSRCREQSEPIQDEDTDVTGSGTALFDVRTLAETQARFRSAVKRDQLSMGRWMELSKLMFDVDGSREVDKVPVKISEAEVGVQPRDMPATDGAGLGQWQSLYDFKVNHDIGTFTAPEHGLISHFLIVRFASITECVMPLATTRANWFETVADPEYISQARLQQVQIQDLIPNTSATSLGYLPSDWKWKCDHDVIGTRIEAMDSFPFMKAPETQAHGKDATRIKNAFRSSRFGDYVVDLYFTEKSRQPIGTSMDSYFTGMIGDAKGQNQTNATYPHGGKML
jgi:hypothetical protein